MAHRVHTAQSRHAQHRIRAALCQLSTLSCMRQVQSSMHTAAAGSPRTPVLPSAPGGCALSHTQCRAQCWPGSYAKSPHANPSPQPADQQQPHHDSQLGCRMLAMVWLVHRSPERKALMHAGADGLGCALAHHPATSSHTCPTPQLSAVHKCMPAQATIQHTRPKQPFTSLQRPRACSAL